MIALVAVPAIYLTMLQAVINVPRDAFRNCLKESSAKANTEKVTGDAFDGWVRGACNAQMTTLRNAIVGFNMKNGMSHREAASDADMTVDDYVASSVDHYKFMAEVNKPAATAAATAPAATPPVAAVATPAAAPQPPK
jgi:hypothetical protein